ncbi:hypothetical protein SAMN04487761_1295 [Lachnospiraceae bacterium C7]|nr:hypothetical protein SAMN04487761_1295 [Lachnospiraceae bacterium C7]
MKKVNLKTKHTVIDDSGSKEKREILGPFIIFNSIIIDIILIILGILSLIEG